MDITIGYCYSNVITDCDGIWTFYAYGNWANEADAVVYECQTSVASYNIISINADNSDDTNSGSYNCTNDYDGSIWDSTVAVFNCDGCTNEKENDTVITG